jgi:transcriptional regulator with XRE-family HTH domain
VPDRTTAIRKAFGNAVRTERLSRKMTQEVLAERADLSLNFIGTVERGEQSPTLDSIVRLAQAMRMTGGELLTRAEL